MNDRAVIDDDRIIGDRCVWPFFINPNLETPSIWTKLSNIWQYTFDIYYILMDLAGAI